MKQTRQSLAPVVQLSDYYNDLSNALSAFGNAKVAELKSLEIEGMYQPEFLQPLCNKLFDWNCF